MRRPLMNVMMPLVAMFRRCASLEMRTNLTKLSIYFTLMLYCNVVECCSVLLFAQTVLRDY